MDDKVARLVFEKKESFVKIHQRQNNINLDGGKADILQFEDEPVKLSFTGNDGYIQVGTDTFTVVL